jgi:hypothetical protein
LIGVGDFWRGKYMKTFIAHPQSRIHPLRE